MGQNSGCLTTYCCDESEQVVFDVAKLPASKLRPLLFGLEADFAEFADKEGRIKAEELRQVWEECARRVLGSLTDGEKQTIQLCSVAYIESSRTGLCDSLCYQELLQFLLGTEDFVTRCPPRLRYLEVRDLALLHERLHDYSTRVLNGNTGLSCNQLSDCISELTCHCVDTAEDPHDLAVGVWNELKNAGNPKVDLWEAIAMLAGRCKRPVELFLYDISNGISRVVSPLLLGQKFEAIYHSSVVAFGEEYWYGGCVFQNAPPLDASVFGPPLKSSEVPLTSSQYVDGLHAVHLGYTLATVRELEAFLQEVKPRYTRKNYDVLTHNCNCFSDEVVRYLTGTGIPDRVLRLPELILSTPTAVVLRPVLNHWLRGFQGTMPGSDRADEVDCYPSEGHDSTLSTASFGERSDGEDGGQYEFDMMRDEVHDATDDSCGVDGNCSDKGGDFPEPWQWARRTRQCAAIKRVASGSLVNAREAPRATEFETPILPNRKAVRRQAIKMLPNGQMVRARPM